MHFKSNAIFLVSMLFFLLLAKREPETTQIHVRRQVKYLLSLLVLRDSSLGVTAVAVWFLLVDILKTY